MARKKSSRPVGRPSLPPDQVRVKITVQVDPRTLKAIDACKDPRAGRAEVIDRAIPALIAAEAAGHDPGDPERGGGNREQFNPRVLPETLRLLDGYRKRHSSPMIGRMSRGQVIDRAMVALGSAEKNLERIRITGVEV